jgi:CRP-like cAMP-binding protein
MSDKLLTDQPAQHRDPVNAPAAVPLFCVRYESEGMERTKPLRTTSVAGSTICTGRPFALEMDCECRVLLHCKAPSFSMWADAVVTDAPPPFEGDERFRGVRLLGQGKFQLEDYLDAVSEALSRFFGNFEQFEHFTRDDCRALARVAGTRQLVRGEALYHVGEQSPDENDLFLVTAGSLKAYKLDPGDPADNIAAITVGQLLGENSFVIDQPHTASIAALVDAWLIQFSRSGLRHLEIEQPRLFIKMYKLITETLVRRLARTTARWKKYDL